MLNSSRRKERENEFSKEKDALLEMYFGEEYDNYENEKMMNSSSKERKFTTESDYDFDNLNKNIVLDQYKSDEFLQMFRQKTLIIPYEDTQSKSFNQNKINNISLDNNYKLNNN